jgi:uncharacterized protein (TIGR00255 family)
MTGFGRASFALGGSHFDVEVRSVNHRFLDLGVRMPRLLSAFEPDVRARVQERFARGKTDVSVSLPGGAAAAARVEIDLGAAAQYVEAAAALAAKHGLEGTLEPGALLSLPGVARAVERELEEAPLRAALLAALDAALDAADAMRRREGEALAADLRGRLARVTELAAAIEGRSGDVVQAQRERLRRRSEQLRQETGLVDEARLAQEIVIAADRLDITEELVRLRSHVEQFGRILDEGGPKQPAGRRLDFLLQELGREANTMGSKGTDAPIAHLVVDLKSELERVREQVQNVE